MTVQEKSNRIYELFSCLPSDKAKEACNLFVDYIIKEYVLLQVNEFHDAWVIERVKMWKEVKSEIEKM